MTIKEYLLSYNLIDSSGTELTNKAKNLQFTSVDELMNEVQDTCIVDLDTRDIILAYKYLEQPIAVVGDSSSVSVKFRVLSTYQDYNLSTSSSAYVQWRNNTDEIEGIDEVIATINDCLELKWIVNKKALTHSGDLQFALRFINVNADYSLSTKTATLNIETSLNYMFTTQVDSDYVITTPLSIDEIDCGNLDNNE